MKYLDPKADLTFKKIFGNQQLQVCYSKHTLHRCQEQQILRCNTNRVV